MTPMNFTIYVKNKLHQENGYTSHGTVTLQQQQQNNGEIANVS
jgi:hypothetical protein